MKRTIFLTVLFFSFFVFPKISQAATYYLSPTGNNATGTGSYDNPWFSPERAKKSASAIQAGDTVIFKNGRYSYPSDDYCRLSSSDGGEIGNPITYKAETNGQVILDFESHKGWDIGAGADNIILEDFIIVNIGNYGIRLNAANLVARNCNVTATDNWPPSGEIATSAISGGCITSIPSAMNFLYENIIADNCAYGGGSSHGAYIAGGSGIIRNSIFRNNKGGNGIQIQSAGPAHIIGNLNVYGNKVYNNGGRLYISTYDYNGSGHIGNVYVYNNLIWNNGLTGGPSLSVSQSGGSTIDDAYIFNNTIANATNGITCYTVPAVVRNNVIANMAGDYIDWNTRNYAGLVTSNNCIQGHVSGIQFQSEDDCAHSLASLDESSEIFLKPTDLSTNLIDKGVDLSSYFSTDFAGTSRPQGAGFDIGAYEYAENTPVDILAPASPGGLSVR
jgi:hypothetical protein